MRINLVIAVLIGVTVAAAACNDTTAPAPSPHLATLANIHVTDHASFGDTVKVAFNYYTSSCDTGIVVQARPIAGGLRFSVTSFPTNRPCTLEASLSVVAQPPIGYVVNPPHVSPLRLVFAQPGGTDSVRVVAP